MDADAALAAQLAEEDARPSRKLANGSSSSLAVASGSNLKLTSASAAAPDPRDQLKDALDLLRGKVTCGNCKAQAQRKPGKASFTVGTDPTSQILRQCHITCGSCYTVICAGCGEESECEAMCESDQSNGCPTANHCVNVRAVLLFEALATFDRLYLELKRPLSTAHPTKKVKAGSGVGYGRGYGANIGKAGDPDDMDEDELPKRDRSKEKAQAESASAAQNFASRVDARVDTLLTTALASIFVLIPRTLDDDDAETYDYVPHKALLPLIQLSTLPETLSELLRNDSVSAVSERLKLYTRALDLLQRLAHCQLLTPLLTEPRWQKDHTDGLGAFVVDGGEIEWERDQGKNRGHEIVCADPLYSQLRRLAKNARTFVRISQSSKRPEEDSKDSLIPMLPTDEVAEKAAVEALKLAEKVVDYVEKIDEAIQEHGVELPDTARPPLEGGSRAAQAYQAEYAAMHENLAFEMVSDLVPQAARALGQGPAMVMSPANANHLNKELSQLAGTLPPGIFIRVDEGSINEMRALIAGPDDTPYAAGLFEFSFKLPWDYPARCPTVKILTTAGGRVRFNPNLYSEGKVCLSLLGTWAGEAHEQWQPWKSTLAQILISIQSMIMNDTPYYNEPGMSGGVQEVADYNKNVRLQNVRWAMVDWLQDTHLNGLWGEVIRQHFTIRRASIRAMLQKWQNEDSRMDKWNAETMPACGSQPPRLTGGGGAGSMNLPVEFEKRMDTLASS